MKPRPALLLAVIAAWAALHYGVLSYIFLHPAALSLAVIPQTIKALSRLAIMIWLLASAVGLGRRLLKPLSHDYADQSERAILEAGLGLGLISHGLFIFGLLHLWEPAPLAVLFGLSLIPAWTAWRLLWSKAALPRRATWTQALFACPIILAALYGFISANAPPTEWDCLAVHLELPRLYAQLGALQPMRWLAHGFDPMAVEMFYVPALVFKAPELPAMTTLLFQGLMAAALWIFGRRIFSRPIALAAVSLFLVQPAVSYVSGTPGTDFGVGLFAMLSFWTAWRAMETKQGPWLILSGALAGLAAVSKTTGVFLAAALGLMIAVRVLGRERELRRWALGWAAVATLFALPWLLRTFIYTHNPVWPYLPRLFGGSPRDYYIFARARTAALEGLGSGWQQLLLLPCNLVFKAESFRHSSQLLMIPLLILGLADWRAAWKDSFTRWTVDYTAVFAVLWFHGVQNWRYFIPLMPWLCLLACAWAARFWEQGGWGKLLAAVLAAGFLGIPALSANNALFPVLGLRPRDPERSPQEAYLSRSLSSYPAMAHINRTAPADARILLYREVRPFYLERDYLIGDPQNDMLIRYEELKTPAELYQRLRELRVTAVLVEPRLETFSPYVPGFLRAEALMKDMLERFAASPLDINGVRLYSWKAP